MVTATQAGSSGTRLTDGFAQVEAEVAKLASASGQAVDWSVVGRESEKYLKDQGKDLRLATYLVLAWVETQGVQGLRRGLDLLVGLLDSSWEQLHPPVEKLQARAGALTFLSEQLPRRLEMLLATKVDEQAGQALVDSFVRYCGVVAKRFPERPPALSPIEKAIGVAQEAKHLPPFPAKAEAEPAQAETSEGADDPLLAPIRADAPAGDDPKLSDEFDAVYIEIEKLAAIEPAPVDWTMVRDVTAKILGGHSKDLRCLVYWSVARLHLDKLEGLREALTAVVACVEKFGDDIHPKRPKARAAALRWLGTRLEEDLPKIAKSAPEADLTALHGRVDAAEKALGGRAASLDGLQRSRAALMAIKVEKPKPVAKPTPAPVAKPTASASASPAKPAPPPAAPAAAVPSELEDLVETLLEQARDLASSGDNAFSLRLRRQALWLAEPSLMSGRKYDCVSLGMKPRMELTDLAKKKEWVELLERTESMFPSHPFCLDLTVWAGQAAAELLGEDAALGLAGELVALSVRCPKLLRGTDRNGQPLASKEARAWINEHKGDGGTAPTPAPTAPSTAAAAPSAAAPTTAPVAAAPLTLPDDIEAMFKNGQAAEAMRRASAAAVGLHGRAGFQRNLLLAERLLDNRAGALAYPLFRALLGQLRTASLTQWEPAVGARCIRGYLQCVRSSNATIEDERELIDELMLLDPSAAIGLV
ncbi:MAG: TssA family type VI secretion system protein [Nannocystaceae bacterium]